MELLNVLALERARRKHRDAAEWLERWAASVLHADWRNIADVRRVYPAADGVRLKKAIVTVFNVKGNEYRLLTMIRYSAQQVIVMDFLTHAEYSKDRWKDW